VYGYLLFRLKNSVRVKNQSQEYTAFIKSALLVLKKLEFPYKETHLQLEDALAILAK